jgi:hypothetical protein
VVDPVANLASVTVPSSSPAVKIATPDLILFNDQQIPEETMIDLVFEDIGGQEMINIVRNDLINGQNQSRQIVRNLSQINLDYNPNNILSLQDTSASYFNNFPIRFEQRVPDIGTGPNGESIYIELDTGNIIINLIGLSSDEQVEVQILKSGSILSGTIYEVND